MVDDKLAQAIHDRADGVNKDEIEERLRLIAYGIWEEEGRPHGRAQDHWAEAERRDARSGSQDTADSASLKTTRPRKS